MYRILRTVAARADLIQIAQYTLEQWGQSRLQTYMLELDTTIQKLTEMPAARGQSHEAILPGLRSISHRDHYYIFYIIDENNENDDDNTVTILRVLHQRMNWSRFFE